LGDLLISGRITLFRSFLALKVVATLQLIIFVSLYATVDSLDD